ncbi:MAG: radical SAM protein [Planctomycetes bacterium]|nr:radical SAM protein [Planctomycetota bacterium]
MISKTAVFIKTTISRCPVCLREVAADIEDVDGSVFMTKACPEHGEFRVRLASDARFYHESHGSSENKTCNSSSCGCQSAEKPQDDVDPFEVLSSCIALIEIVDSCNLPCPTCYASSELGVNEKVDCISFDNFRQRVQGVIDRKGMIDVLQLSGGEPTLHPEFFTLLDWALANQEIGYILLNTNGLRIARDKDFRRRLAESRSQFGKFELYMQFDGVQEEGQLELRGADLRAIKQEAIDECGALGVPSTLAMVVSPLTIGYLGDTLRFGLERSHCRGITFQPMFTSGRIPRTPHIESNLPIAQSVPSPISVGDVIKAVVSQSEGLLTEDDFTPLPCGDPNCHTVGYLLRSKQGTIGISRLIDLSSLQGFLGNRVNYRLEDLSQCGCESEPLGDILRQFEIGPEQPFRLFIKPFMDAWTFDQDRIDRCCTHVIRRDGTLDSFCRYYLHGGAAGHPGHPGA